MPISLKLITSPLHTQTNIRVYERASLHEQTQSWCARNEDESIKVWLGQAMRRGSLPVWAIPCLPLKCRYHANGDPAIHFIIMSSPSIVAGT